MLKVLENWGNPDLIEDTQNLEPVFYDPASFEQYEAQFRTPEVQEVQEEPGTSKRVLAALGAATLIAGLVGHETAQPNEQPAQISAERIAEDLNEKGTAKPVPIKKGQELVIPKTEATDTPFALNEPLDLGKDEEGMHVYSVVEFDKNCKAEVLTVKSEKAVTPINEGTKEEAETSTIVYPISVVHTNVPGKNGKTEKLCSLVTGEKSGNAADLVKIDMKLVDPKNKQLLQDEPFEGLVKATLSTVSLDEVAHLDEAS
jgi:hypothetical protein